MTKKVVVALALLSFIILYSQVLLSPFSVNAVVPSNLKIFIAPPTVLADKGEHEIILIQLQDSKGSPARASEDTTISLSSSQTNIGTVDSSIVISQGLTQATAKFYTTYSPGTTKITAAATGYSTVEASITTVGPIPSTLAVYGFPPVLPADGGTYQALVVQLQDSSGSPAKAPLEEVQVTLSSSNNTIVSVVPSVIIEAGSTYATATINTAQGISGSAVITAMASGYSSKQTTITTQIPVNQAANLKIYVGPPKVLAEGKSYKQILVQLQNSLGTIAHVSSNVTVTLSSVATEIGTVEPTATIIAFQTFTAANFTSTYRSGKTTITAAATDYNANQETVTTVGPIPIKLAVYCLPSLLPADNTQYKSIQVQLQDAAGNPAKDPEGAITVNLFSSDPEGGTVDPSLTISFGETYATGIFTSTAAANKTTTITAQTSGYESGQTLMKTQSIDEFVLAVTVTETPETMQSGQQITLRVRVNYNGTVPMIKANVVFSCNLDGATFSNVSEDGGGYYSTLFTAPNAKNNTVCTFMINATKTGYVTGMSQLKITINPSEINTSTLQVQIVNENSNSISSANVTLLPQLDSVQQSEDSTDESGYATFEGIIEGTYIIEVTKEGYNAKNETITCPAGTNLFQTITLVETPFLSRPLILPIIVAIVVIVVVAVVTVSIYIMRRRNSYEEISEESVE